MQNKIKIGSRVLFFLSSSSSCFFFVNLPFCGPSHIFQQIFLITCSPNPNIQRRITRWLNQQFNVIQMHVGNDNWQNEFFSWCKTRFLLVQIYFVMYFGSKKFMVFNLVRFGLFKCFSFHYLFHLVSFCFLIFKLFDGSIQQVSANSF